MSRTALWEDPHSSSDYLLYPTLYILQLDSSVVKVLNFQQQLVIPFPELPKGHASNTYLWYLQVGTFILQSVTVISPIHLD